MSVEDERGDRKGFRWLIYFAIAIAEAKTMRSIMVYQSTQRSTVVAVNCKVILHWLDQLTRDNTVSTNVGIQYPQI